MGHNVQITYILRGIQDIEGRVLREEMVDAVGPIRRPISALGHSGPPPCSPGTVHSSCPTRRLTPSPAWLSDVRTAYQTSRPRFYSRPVVYLLGSPALLAMFWQLPLSMQRVVSINTGRGPEPAQPRPATPPTNTYRIKPLKVWHVP